MPTTLKLADRYLDEKRRTGRITAGTSYDQRHILRAFAELAPQPSQVNKRAVLRWFDSVAHVAPATRRTRYSTVRGFTSWLCRRGHIKRDPCLEIPPPKVPRPARRILTTEQADALLAACEDLTDYLILALGFDLGLRRGEQARLEMGDVVLDSHPTITIVGKSGHARVLPLPLTTIAVLRRYIAARGVTAGPLIRLSRYPERGVQPVWIGRRFTELAYRAGIKAKPNDGVSHHTMRRSLATKLWRATGDAPLVAEVLGHDGLASLRHYVNAADVERMRVALNA